MFLYRHFSPSLLRFILAAHLARFFSLLYILYNIFSQLIEEKTGHLASKYQKQLKTAKNAQFYSVFNDF